MIGAALGAIPGIIGAIMQMNAQKQANDISLMNLYQQRDNAQKQFDLATAGRTDVYGNKESFDPLTNQWKTTLTPQQQAITDAQQAEQLRSMTEDAQRARDLRARQEVRSKEAGQDYETIRNQYLYNPPKSEGAYQDEAVTDALFAQQDQAREAGKNLATLAVRSGQSSDALAGIVNAVAQQMGKGVGGALQQGKAQGRQTAQQEQGIQTQRANLMKEFASIMDDIGGYNKEAFNTPADMAALQKEQVNNISSALANQSNQLSSAYGSLARTAGQYPDLSGIAQYLSKFGDALDTSKGGTLNAPYVQPGVGSSSVVGSDTSTPMSDRIAGVRTYGGSSPSDTNALTSSFYDPTSSFKTSDWTTFNW